MLFLQADLECIRRLDDPEPEERRPERRDEERLLLEDRQSHRGIEARAPLNTTSYSDEASRHEVIRGPDRIS
jgi:hypothetical protein